MIIIMINLIIQNGIILLAIEMCESNRKAGSMFGHIINCITHFPVNQTLSVFCG